MVRFARRLILGKSRYVTFHSMVLFVMGTYKHWWWIEIIRCQVGRDS